MGVATSLFAVKQLKRIEQRQSGSAQQLPGPRSIGHKEFDISDNKIWRYIQTTIIIIKGSRGAFDRA